LWGVFPSLPGISWEGHLFGFLSGILAAKFIHER
jgi:membrane associated rhomboid family serine protease